MIKKTIGDLCHILNGYAFKSSHYVENGVRIIRIANVQKGYIDFSDKAFYPSDLSFIKNYMLKEGDILMSLTGNVGRVALLTADLLPAALNQRVACLRLKDESIYKKFLFHYLNSSSFENRCIRESKGVAQKNMSTEWLKKQKIPYFEMVKQKEISKVLDNITNIINKKQQQISKYDELIKSRFFEMFGDVRTNSLGIKTKPGKDLFKFSSGKFLSENLRFNFGVPVYGGNGVAWYTKDSLIDYSTIVIGRVGAYCGNIKFVKEPIWITDNAIYIKEFYDESFNLDFLFEMMKMIDFSRFADYSGQPKITQKPLEESLFLIPPRKDQEEFSRFVHQIEKIKLKKQKSINETQKLFDSLMQEYFG
jgi:type I restriction enzyme S subunit